MNTKTIDRLGWCPIPSQRIAVIDTRAVQDDTPAVYLVLDTPGNRKIIREAIQELGRDEGPYIEELVELLERSEVVAANRFVAASSVVVVTTR